MRFTFIIILSAAFLTCLFACKSPGSAGIKKEKSASLTIHLPFESSNYYNDKVPDINFILKDSAGRPCTATTDTVTKGGGTVIYDSLALGRYTYSINTIFKETVTGIFQLTGDTSISLSAGDIYGKTDAIALEELAAADSVKIILSDTLLTSTVTIRKENNKYSIYLVPDDKRKPAIKNSKDSAATIQALIELQVSLLGLQAMEIYEQFDMPYEPTTSFYMKTGRSFINCTDIQQRYFYAAHKKFITTIVSK